MQVFINLNGEKQVKFPIGARIELEKKFGKKLDRILQEELDNPESIIKILAIGLRWGEGEKEFTVEVVETLLNSFEESFARTIEVITDAIGYAINGPSYEQKKKEAKELEDKIMKKIMDDGLEGIIEKNLKGPKMIETGTEST